MKRLEEATTACYRQPCWGVVVRLADLSRHDAEVHRWTRASVPETLAGVPKENHTPLRSIRVHGALWEAAQRVAAEHGETLSDVMRRALEEYVRTGGRPKKSREKS